MPLAATDLTQLGETPITVLSNFYPNIYLRMDATGLTSGNGGVVNCSYGVGDYELFRLQERQISSTLRPAFDQYVDAVRLMGSGLSAAGPDAVRPTDDELAQLAQNRGCGLGKSMT